MSESKGSAQEAERTTPSIDMDDESGDEVDTEEKFDWDQYLTETKSNAAAADCFWQSPTPPKNQFKVGHKLEAVDPRNSSITSVATVVAVYGPKLKIRLDGAGSSNDFWTLVDSSKIHPFGYTEKNGGHLQPPWSYERDPVRYQNSIINAAKESGNLAPESCFMDEPPRPNANLFKTGTKLEAIDARNPTWVCPATVVDLDREKIKIEYDGWDQQDLVRYDSRDLYPCGWWKQAGIGLAKPPTVKKRPPSTGKRGRPPLKRPIRPHSVGPVSAQSTASEPRNIFDAVLAKSSVSVTPSPQPQPSSPVTTSKTNAQTSAGSDSNTIGSVEKSSSGTNSPVNASKDASQVLLKHHHARKTIAARPESASREKKSTEEASNAVKEVNNGTINHDHIADSNGIPIPEPDAVVPLGSKSADVKKFALHFNALCNGGPYLDLAKLEMQCAAIKEALPMQLLVREAFQILVYSARPESTVQVFNAIPAAEMKSTKGLTVSCFDKDQCGIIRTIPMYSTAAAAKRALKDVLTSVKACLNLISTDETGCNICCDGPVAKKLKLSNTGITIDLTRKTKHNDGGAAGDVLAESQEPAAWWSGQDPSKWSVDDVVRFIDSVIGPEAATMFKSQEIDGNALILLTPEILIKFMDVRVGPAVKISNAIERLKGTNRPNFVASPSDVPGTSTGGLGRE